jgi:hypothetical protein
LYEISQINLADGFVTGRMLGMVTLLSIMLASTYYIYSARKGKVPKIRRIAGIDAIDEAIGRAVEMGRSVFFNPGIGDLTGAGTGPQTIAGLGVLNYVSKKCVDVSTRLIVPVRNTTVWPIAADIVETAYRLAGKQQEYRAGDIMFLSSDQFGFTSSYLGLLMREKPGANIMIGAYWAESMQLATTGARVGCIQIAGTAAVAQIPYFVLASDYCLIGEEIYAASSYVAGEGEQIASLAGQDFGRLLCVAVMLLGALLNTGGIKLLIDLFKW